MNYWLDAFTGTTWQEFRNAGASVSGFNERFRKHVGRLRPGDILLCYMTYVMRWVGALEVVGPTDDQQQIWSESGFPVRVAVKPLILLDAEHGIPMSQLAGQTSFYASPKDAGKFKGIVRLSPNLLKPEDGKVILELLRSAETQPVVRPVDQRKLNQKFFAATRKKGKTEESVRVTVPDDREGTIEETPKSVVEDAVEATDHTRVQHLLLELGHSMGF